MRVMIQLRYSPQLHAARTATSFAIPEETPSLAIAGFALDLSYTPVLLPDRQPRQQIGEREVGRLFSFNAAPEV